MGKGRPTPERQNLMLAALEKAYETLREKNKASFPSWREITDEANTYEFIKDSTEGKIGDKTLEQSTTPKIKTLRERIKDERKLFEKIKAQMPTALSIRTEELQSSLEANALLAQDIERLEKTIENKNNSIIEKDKLIADYEDIIRHLRRQISDITRETR